MPVPFNIMFVVPDIVVFTPVDSPPPTYILFPLITNVAAEPWPDIDPNIVISLDRVRTVLANAVILLNDKPVPVNVTFPYNDVALPLDAIVPEIHVIVLPDKLKLFDNVNVPAVFITIGLDM